MGAAALLSTEYLAVNLMSDERSGLVTKHQVHALNHNSHNSFITDISAGMPISQLISQAERINENTRTSTTGCLTPELYQQKW